MADSKATVVLDLKDEVSGPTNAAANSLDKLKEKIQADVQALRDMQAAMGRLKGNTADVTAEKKKLADKITATKDSMGKAQAEYLKAGGSLKALGKNTKDTGKETGTTSALMGEMGLSVAGVALAAVAALAAIGAAAVALSVFAFNAAAAAGQSRLLMAAWGGSARMGQAMSDEVNYLARRIPLARDELAKLAQDLAAKGLKGGALLEGVSAIGTVTAVLGASAGAKLQSIAENAVRTKRMIIGMFDLQGSGVSLDEVAKTLGTQMHMGTAAAKAALQNGTVQIDAGMKALDATVQGKFGKTAEEMFLSPTNQMQKFEESLSDIFSSIDVVPAEKALHEVLSLFDANTASGFALRQLAKTIFDPLFGSAAKAGSGVASAIKTMIGWALKMEIGVLEASIYLKKLVPPSVRPSIDVVTAGLQMLAVVGGVVAGGLALFAAAALLPVAALVALQTATNAAGAWLRGLDWSAIGKALIDGLVGGITAGIGSVTSAVTHLGSSATSALRSAIKSSSPSKITHEIGGDFTGGFAIGQTDSIPDVERAAQGVGHAASSALQDSASAKSAMGKGGKSKSSAMPQIVINVTDNGDKESMFRSAFTQLLEQMNFTAGFDPEPAPA